MRYQEKVIFNAISFPIACSMAVVLFLYYQLFKLKASSFKNFHDTEAHWDYMPFLASIAHEYRTEFIVL